MRHRMLQAQTLAVGARAAQVSYQERWFRPRSKTLIWDLSDMGLSGERACLHKSVPDRL